MMVTNTFNTFTMHVSNIQERSRLNQNIIIDKHGLRIGRKVWIKREDLPQSIQESSLSFCVALRGPINLEELIGQISRDKKLLSGETKWTKYFGVSVTSKFNRVLLVAPDFQRVKKFVSPSLGLERIAAYLRHTNETVDVETLDPNLMGEISDEETTDPNDPRLGRNRLVAHVRAQHYDIIGFSSLTPTLKHDALNLMEVSASFGEKFEKPLFIMGNYGVLLGAEELFGSLPSLDALVWGPGEYPLAAILESLQQHLRRNNTLSSETVRAAVLSTALAKNFSPAIMATRESGIESFPKGKIFPSVTVQQLEKLESLVDHYAIPYEDHWKKGYESRVKNLRFHISTTSCPYGCLFCSTTKGGLLFVPVEKVIEMFRHASHAYPEITAFSFTDDNLFIRKDYLLELAEKIRRTPEWREEFTFYCQSRPDSVEEEDGELLQSLYRMGFRHIAIGVESFSEKSLAELNKGATAKQALQTIRTMREYDLWPIVNLILFPPNVTLKDLCITVEKALEVSKDPKQQIDPNFMLAAFSGAPLTMSIEQGFKGVGRNQQKSLTRPWIRETEIIYEHAYRLKIPLNFKIVRELMEKLCIASIQLSREAVKLTHTNPNDLGRKGLVITWSIISMVVRNSKLFDDSTAGEGTTECIEEFNRLAIELREAIKIRYPQEADEILRVLDNLGIPSLT